MGLRECYIILGLCASIYAAALPENSFKIVDDENVPSTTFRNSKDILHGFEDDGALNVEEDLAGVPLGVGADNGAALNPFPTYPANDVQTTQKPQKPVTTSVPPPHHPFFFKPRHPLFFPRIKAAIQETAQENREAFRKKMEALFTALRGFQEAGRTIIESNVNFANTLPRFMNNLQNKFGEEKTPENL